MKVDRVSARMTFIQVVSVYGGSALEFFFGVVGLVVCDLKGLLRYHLSRIECNEG